ncbi:putative halogenase [Mycena amicta]|nr:putative halogenase [Mycena amicta]
MSTLEIPEHSDILVIGGGPAGSYAAAALAREGYQVTLLEKDHFPRYHIGESMLPSCRPFMRFIDVEQKVVDFGFLIKVGAAFKFNHNKREGYTDFINPNPNNAAWNVTRADFDELLLRNAAEQGVHVVEGVTVGAINFADPSAEPTKLQPVSLEWKTDKGTTGETKFKYLVDASGRNGLMSTRYLKNRNFNKALRSVAFWGNATWLEALTDESGWVWFIPLAGKVSVGIVLKEDISKEKKKAFTGPDATLDFYHAQLKFVPGVQKLLENATFQGEVMSAGDYSYSAPAHAGPNYRIAGDAGAFIDPYFSSGVHLAFNGGLAAATTISASIRGDCSEEEAIQFHTSKVGASYTRFMMVVLAAYRQILHQSVPVLTDVAEDNYDRAFSFIRPVIQGMADANSAVTEDILQSTMDFCEHAMGMTDPEMHEDVAKRVDPKLLEHEGPLLSVQEIKAIAGDDEDAEIVLRRVQARKTLEALHWQPNFRGESFSGLSIRLERGKLGLNRDAVKA